MVSPRSFVWTVVLCCLSGPAFSQQQDPHEVEARTDCLTGKAESGVALLADLFARTGNPNFVYNQARCYEQNDRPEEAINRFREYLRVARDATDAEKADVEKHMADCRARRLERDGEKAQRAAATAVAEPSSLASTLTSTDGKTTSETAPFYKSWWFLGGTAAAVVAGTITAIVLATRSSNACDGASLSCLGVK
jgi:hypothetical protein